MKTTIRVNGKEFKIKPLADLRDANLHRANLYLANLCGANLCGAVGNGREVKSMQIAGWPIVWTETDLAIGCKQFPISEWLEMSEDEIAKIGHGAVEFAGKYGDLIREAVKL